MPSFLIPNVQSSIKLWYENYVYSIFIITVVLLNKCILHAKVLHVAPSELLMQNQMEQVSHSKIVWRMSEEEGDAEIFFKVDNFVITTPF